jgi:hypothetical protein
MIDVAANATASETKIIRQTILVQPSTISRWAN